MPHLPGVSDCAWVHRVCMTLEREKSQEDNCETSRAGKGACQPAALKTEEVSLPKKDKPGERVGRKSPEPGKLYGSPKG